jgi:hypothetical protein
MNGAASQQAARQCRVNPLETRPNTPYRRHLIFIFSLFQLPNGWKVHAIWCILSGRRGYACI